MEQLIRDGNVRGVKEAIQQGTPVTIDTFKNLIWIGRWTDGSNRKNIIKIGILLLDKLVEKEQTHPLPPPPKRSWFARMTRRQLPQPIPTRVTLREKLDDIKHSVTQWLDMKLNPGDFSAIVRYGDQIQREKAPYLVLLDEIMSKYDEMVGLAQVSRTSNVPKDVQREISKFLGGKTRKLRRRKRRLI